MGFWVPEELKISWSCIIKRQSINNQARYLISLGALWRILTSHLQKGANKPTSRPKRNKPTPQKSPLADLREVDSGVKFCAVMKTKTVGNLCCFPWNTDQGQGAVGVHIKDETTVHRCIPAPMEPTCFLHNPCQFAKPDPGKPLMVWGGEMCLSGDVKYWDAVAILSWAKLSYQDIIFLRSFALVASLWLFW